MRLNLVEPTNRLLAALPQEDYQRLLPDLEAVELTQHQILYHPGEEYQYAYFPARAVISSVAILQDGSMTEIGIIGNKGMVGLPIILDTQYTSSTAIVQVSGSSYKISRKTLQKELARHGSLRNLLMRYVQARIVQLGQTAGCNSYHNIEQRFARWLLTVSDSVQEYEFQLTQEFMAQMLGVPRSALSASCQ